MYTTVYLYVEDEIKKKIVSEHSILENVERSIRRKQADEAYICKWIHFEKLKFLDDFMFPKNSSSNLQVSKTMYNRP